MTLVVVYTLQIQKFYDQPRNSTFALYSARVTFIPIDAQPIYGNFNRVYSITEEGRKKREKKTGEMLRYNLLPEIG